MKLMKRTAALALSLALAFALAGCAKEPAPAETPAPTPSQTVEATPTPEPSPDATPTPAADRPEVSVAMLKGPTGIGAAKLMADSDAGATALDYDFTVAAAPDELTGKIINGELDIAAIPTNLAATLYNKTEQGIKMVALNTLGVLYILENGSSVQSMADLRGKTIYATGQGANPEYVLNYLLAQNGLTPGEDVTIEWKASDELTTLMAGGEIDLCMLPVPAATGVLMQNQEVCAALDLTQEWDHAVSDGSILTMGCVVVQSRFAEEHPELVETFLQEYAASIDYVIHNPDEAAELVAQYGITPKAAIAKAAIPQANLVCITGREMHEGIDGYYEVLYQADPKSIGGAIPDDAFYYLP